MFPMIGLFSQWEQKRSSDWLWKYSCLKYNVCTIGNWKWAVRTKDCAIAMNQTIYHSRKKLNQPRNLYKSCGRLSYFYFDIPQCLYQCRLHRIEWCFDMIVKSSRAHWSKRPCIVPCMMQRHDTMAKQLSLWGSVTARNWCAGACL